MVCDVVVVGVYVLVGELVIFWEGRVLIFHSDRSAVTSLKRMSWTLMAL